MGMKRKSLLWGILAWIMGVGISLTGCAGRQDTIRFIYENTGLPNKESVSYEVNIGNQVGGASVLAELWQNGECTVATPLTLNQETEHLYVSLLIDGFGTEEGTKGLHVQMETDELSGSVLTYFELPEGIRAYSFNAYEDEEMIKVNAGEEVLLGALAFDVGKGVRTVACKSLLDEPEKLKDYSCILIVRAVFTAEQISPQSEAPASR